MVCRTADKLPWYRLLAYAFPSFALAAMTMPIYIYLPVHYGQTLGLGLASVGFILMIARIWDVVSDPLIGYYSDQWGRSRGRRKVWITAGVPLVMVSAWFLLIPPDAPTISHLLFWSLALYTGWTIVILPLNAMGAELSTDYNRRSLITGWREGMTIAGLLAALALTAIYQDYALQILAVFAIVILPISVAGLLKFTPEPIVMDHKTPSFWNGLKILSGNKPFRLLIGSYLINGLANAFPASLFLLFVEHGLGMKDDAGGLLFMFFFSGLLTVPLWLKLSFHFGKHRVWCAAMIWTCAFFLLVPFVGDGDYWLFFAICILTGFGLGADLTLPGSMQADVVDVDIKETGTQRTGLYFALWSMATKLSLALAAGIVFPILEWAGFQDGQTGNLTVLVILYSAIPVVLKLIAVAMMARFPLNELRVAETRQEISRLWE